MPNNDTYKTLAGISEGLYREKGSKFISIARSVSSPEEIDIALAQAKKRYHDARHHCYAWVLGKAGESYRANDGGEPSHSAGDPILGQIRSRDLTDTLVVVIRYFGGTKLGIGGLIQAYRAAASDALDNNKIVTKTVKKLLMIRFAYDKTGSVMRLIEEANGELVTQQYDASCTVQVLVRERDALKFIAQISLIEGVTVQQ